MYSPGLSCASWWSPLLMWPSEAAEHLSLGPAISANAPGRNLQKIMHQVLTLNKYLYVNSFITKTFTSDTKQSQFICFQTVNLPQCAVPPHRSCSAGILGSRRTPGWALWRQLDSPCEPARLLPLSGTACLRSQTYTTTHTDVSPHSINLKLGEIMHCPASPPAALQLDMQSCEWLHADHVVHDSCCIRVVCAIVEFVDGACWVLEALVPSDKQKKKRSLIKASGILQPFVASIQPLSFISVCYDDQLS